MPAPLSRSVNLEWIHRDRSVTLGLSPHCLGSDGTVAHLRLAADAPRDYFVELLSPALLARDYGDDLSPTPQSARAIEFQSNAIHRAACAADGQFVYATSDGELYLLWLDSQRNPQSLAIPIRHTDRFLGLQTSGSADERRSAAILTQDAAGYSTISVVESSDPGAAGGALRVVWTRSWADAIAAFALSHDGRFLAVAASNGVISLLDQNRAAVWTVSSANASAIAAMAVAETGEMVLIDQKGSIQCLGAATGSVQWELIVPVGESVMPVSMAPGLICCDSSMRFVLAALNRIDAFGELEAAYLLLDGTAGELLWEAAVASPVNGVAASPGGEFGAFSCQDGSTTLLSFLTRADIAAAAAAEEHKKVQALLADAKVVYAGEEYESALLLLNEAIDLDPGLCVGIGYYDDAVWAVRQRALAETKTVSAQSLARVEEALLLLPHDERLTVRRNALSRLLAESVAREGSVLLAESDVEGAIAKYVEALAIDRTLSDVRASLHVAINQLTLTLLKKADAAFYEERFGEAISLLERIAILRPAEDSVLRRLERARGLQAYAAAMEYYVGKQYTEAVFWFRKALTFLPDNRDAAKYLSFAESYLAETTIDPEPTQQQEALQHQINPQYGFRTPSEMKKPTPLPR